MQYFVFFLVLQSSHLGKDGELVDLHCFVFCMSCGFYCYCSLPLHHVDVSGLQYVIVTIPGHTHLL